MKRDDFGEGIAGLLVIGALIALVVGIIFAGPMLVLWALNTLFHLGLSYTPATWTAVLVLCLTLNARVGK